MSPRTTRPYQRLLEDLSHVDGTPGSRKRMTELTTLIELSASLGGELSGAEMLDVLLLTLMRELGTQQGAAFVLGKDNQYECRAARGMGPITLSGFPAAGLDAQGVVQAAQDEWLKASGLELLVPVARDSRRLGALGVGARADGRGYSDEERAFAYAIAACGAGSVESALARDDLREANRRLSLRVFQLSSLLDVSRELAACPDEDAVNSLAVATVMGHLIVSRCALYIEECGSMALAHERGVEGPQAHMPLSRAETAELSAALLLPMSTRELPPGPLRARLIAQCLTTLVPLRAGLRCVGFFALGERVSGAAFGEADWDLVTTLGRQALAALETVRLTRDRSEKRRQDRELQIAREIQQSLFPRSFPQLPGYSLAGATRPCYEVGGDYYDVIPLDGGEWVFIVADVSGKGVPASILMASLHASLRALAGGASPAQTMARLNRFIYASTQPSKFATVFYAQLDVERRRLTYVNGGHIPPFVLRADGGLTRLDAGGAAVGLIDEVAYDSGAIDLAAGDRIAMVTDGMTEARSVRDEEFGEQRLVKALRRGSSRPADAVEALMAAVSGWSGDAGYTDDLTALVVDVGEPGGGQ
jgi:sigma-B regulation protein RsbU (phosphoserine phosphatase)